MVSFTPGVTSIKSWTLISRWWSAEMFALTVAERFMPFDAATQIVTIWNSSALASESGINRILIDLL